MRADHDVVRWRTRQTLMAISDYSVHHVDVLGLVTIDGSLDDPNIDPLFHLSVCFDDLPGMRFSVATKDGGSYRLLDSAGLIGGHFSPEDQIKVKDAIKRYVDDIIIPCSA